MKYIITIPALFMVFLALAQERLVKTADKRFKEQLFNKAIELYEKAHEEDPNSYYIIKRLALANQRINNTIEAEKWVKILFDSERITSGDLLMYSDILIENGKYDSAREVVNIFSEKRPHDKRYSDYIERLDKIETILNDSSAYQIGMVSFNTRGAELGTCFFRDGIVFSSTSMSDTRNSNKYAEDELPFLDLYFAREISPGNFSHPEPFAPKLKTRFNDGPVSYDRSANLFYITQYAPKKVDSEESGVFHLQIIIAEENRGEWTAKEGFFLNSPNYSVAHPSVSHDGKMIYFVSDMPGGYGGYDIYFCYKEGNRWSDPYNIGPNVNTRGDEFFPFIANDGNLYFSSDGHAGLGSMDIFIATAEDGVFTNVRNAGHPVNSPKDDVAFVLNSSSERGYFSSNRVESQGYYDIYSVKVNFVPVTIKGIVKDIGNKAMLADASVHLIDEKGKITAETKTGSNGSFSLLINKVPTFILSVAKPGYEKLEKSVNIEFLKLNEELNLEVFLRREGN